MSESESEVRMIRHVVYVAQPTDKPVYAVQTEYWETDAMNAVGQVRMFVRQEDGIVHCTTALNTNCDLCTICCSPEGNLWVGSTDGHIWTTAEVDWDITKFSDVDCEQSDPHFTWKGTEAIRSPAGRRYNLAALWPASDKDVYAGTFTGHMVHWDGTGWRIDLSNNSRSIQRMHGTGAHDIWAVGRDGLVLHYDGTGWREVPIPGDAGSGENLTGVWALSEQEAYICSTSGAIFHGSKDGLERLGEYSESFYGIAEFEGKLYLPAGDGGVHVLKGNKLEKVKKFASTGVYRLPKTLAFVEPSQDPPCLVMHDPANEKLPWAGWNG